MLSGTGPQTPGCAAALRAGAAFGSPLPLEPVARARPRPGGALRARAFGAGQPSGLGPAPGGADRVGSPIATRGDWEPLSTGEQLPEGYGPNPLVEQEVPFRLGRTISRVNGVKDFVAS